MSLQLIVRDIALADIEHRIRDLPEGCEVFQIDACRVGISVPTRILDMVGDAHVRHALYGIAIYDLYAGVWVSSIPTYEI